MIQVKLKTCIQNAGAFSFLSNESRLSCVAESSN